MDLSIVIVNWNTRELLGQCLASIYAHPPTAEFETLVVDNASTDGSVEMVRTRFPQVRLMPNRENVGFARANNQAIRVSTGQYVLLLNPDTEVYPDALDCLVRFLVDRPSVGAVGPRVLNPDGTLQLSCYPAPTLSRELWRLFHLDALYPYGNYAMTGWRQDVARAVEGLLGACLMLRRSVLDEVGLLDEDYFIYSEEVDLCRRVHAAGWALYWAPEARIIHYGGQSTRQVATEMFLHLYKSKIIYFRKHYGPLGAWLYKMILLLAAVSRLMMTPAAILSSSERRRSQLATAARYQQLVRALPQF